MTAPIDLWAYPRYVKRWHENWLERHKDKLYKPPFPYRVIISGSLDPAHPNNSVDAAAEVCQYALDNGIDFTVGVAHPQVTGPDDWSTPGPWQEVADELAHLHRYAPDANYVALDGELYRTPKDHRYPRMDDIISPEGHRLADALTPLSSWLIEKKLKLLVQQWSPKNSMWHILRLKGVEVIAGDSAQREMTNNSDSHHDWEDIGESALEVAQSRGVLRYPTLTAHDFATYGSVQAALDTSSGRMGVYWNQTLDGELDPDRKYRNEFPLKGWADVLLANSGE